MSGSRFSEAVRQLALLDSIRTSQTPSLPMSARTLPGRDGGGPAGVHDRLAGLRAYRANAQAVAVRALQGAYPVIGRLLGPEALEALARDLWRRHPPVRGDLAWFGGELADWLGRVPELADMAYLPDVARLEWAVHRAGFTADSDEPAVDLAALANADPDDVAVGFVHGAAALASPWPVLSLWAAHQVPDGVEPDLSLASAALAEGRGESAWVWRRGLRVDVAALDAGEQVFHTALAMGARLGTALGLALERCPGFAFDAWLARALRMGWLRYMRAEPHESISTL